MNSGSIQNLYDEYIALLTPAERLRLVELITRGMANLAPTVSASATLDSDPSRISAEVSRWQGLENRSNGAEWRDRAL